MQTLCATVKIRFPLASQILQVAPTDDSLTNVLINSGDSPDKLWSTYTL